MVIREHADRYTIARNRRLAHRSSNGIRKAENKEDILEKEKNKRALTSIRFKSAITRVRGLTKVFCVLRYYAVESGDHS